MLHKQKTLGFTLIELMVVVAIIGILASVAYPSYLDSFRKARRADAQADMVQYAGFAERIFTETNSYVSATTDAASLVDTDFYTYATVPTATAFTITITAQGGQANDVCGTTMSLTNTGATTPATAGCW